MSANSPGVSKYCSTAGTCFRGRTSAKKVPPLLYGTSRTSWPISRDAGCGNGGFRRYPGGGISMGTPWQKTSGLPYTVPLRIALPFPPSTKGVIRRPGLAGPILHRAYWNDWSTWYLSFSEFTCRGSRSGLGGNFRASPRRGEPPQLGDPHHKLALTAGPASRPRIVCPFKTNGPCVEGLSPSFDGYLYSVAAISSM